MMCYYLNVHLQGQRLKIIILLEKLTVLHLCRAFLVIYKAWSFINVVQTRTLLDPILCHIKEVHIPWTHVYS